MDSLKARLAKMNKHLFWVLAALVLIVCLAVWYLETDGLQKAFARDMSSIQSTIGQLRNVANDPTQANETYTQKISVEQEKMQAQSYGIWEESWKNQLPKLTWPAQPPQVAAIAEIDPKDEIPSASREAYMNNSVIPEWTKVIESVNLRRVKGGGEPQPAQGLGGIGALGGGAPAKNVEYEGIVSWDKEQRDELIKRVRFTRTPTTVRVRVAQEDLWVYKALIDVVLQMNAGASDVLNAVVRRIDSMSIAQWAIRHAQDNPGPDLGIKASSDDPAAAFGSQADGRITPPKPEQDIKDEEILDNRYLDQDNRPVKADAIMNLTLDPAKAKSPFAEFRQMFVVMRLVMDQRRVPDLLAACANSSLPIEVRQVLVHMSDQDSTETQKAAAGHTAGTQGERGPFDAMIEVRGIVYLYNKPDQAKLGQGAAQNPARRSLGVPDKSSASPDSGFVPPVDEFAPQ